MPTMPAPGHILTVALRIHDHRRMATTVSVVTTDDLDGSADAETATFGLDGVTYEIELSDKKRAKLDKAFAPYVEHARRVTVRRQRRAGGSTGTGPRIDRAAVRAWAKEQGLRVSERGRISAEVMAHYEAAH